MHLKRVQSRSQQPKPGQDLKPQRAEHHATSVPTPRKMHRTAPVSKGQAAKCARRVSGLLPPSVPPLGWLVARGGVLSLRRFAFFTKVTHHLWDPDRCPSVPIFGLLTPFGAHLLSTSVNRCSSPRHQFSLNKVARAQSCRWNCRQLLQEKAVLGVPTPECERYPIQRQMFFANKCQAGIMSLRSPSSHNDPLCDSAPYSLLCGWLPSPTQHSPQQSQALSHPRTQFCRRDPLLQPLNKPARMILSNC